MDIRAKVIESLAGAAMRFPRAFGLLFRAREWMRSTWCRNAPGARAFRGAALGLLIATVVVVADAVLHRALLPHPTADRLANALRGVRDAGLWGVGIVLLAALVSRFPWRYRLALGACGGILAGSFPFSQDSRGLVWGIVAFSLLGAGLAAIAGGRDGLPALQRRVAVAAIVFGLGSVVFMLWWVGSSGYEGLEYRNAAAIAAQESGARVAKLAVPDPAKPGPFGVRQLTYGSGADIRRPEFGRRADLVTATVDGRPFLDEWNGDNGRERRQFWGFDRDELPLQGRVWYPDGEGPFPLVLIVHGNHSMYEYSDPGYGYLGELLASRGYILVSVDENFINGSIRQENDARGWLLLEHLKVWKAWNEGAVAPETDGPGELAAGADGTPAGEGAPAGPNPFRGKVDMSRIGLIGHSRGGEAVAVAAAFNRLPYYPDDATVPFDYGFEIGAVIAIAPVMGQYQPGGRFTDLLDVNYFVIHGANDGDVSSFNGAGQYEHVGFSGAAYRFKSSLYVMGANHGQFNQVWGDHDSGPPSGRSLSTRGLIPEAQQRRIAEVYISAFLEAALGGEHGYLPLFADARAGAGWLPDTAFLLEFDDSRSLKVATFDEDVDVTTATIPGGRTRGEDLTVWREQRVAMKSRTKETAGVYLGWDSQDESGAVDAGNWEAAPGVSRYVVELPAGFTVEPAGVLFFSAADADESAEMPEHLRKEQDADGQQEEEEEGSGAREQAAHPEHLQQQEERQQEEPQQQQDDDDKQEDEDENAPRDPIDFTVRLVDAGGAAADVPLSRFSMVQPQLQVQLRKAFLSEPSSESEPVFQSFVLPLAWFSEANSDLDPSRPARIELIFDRTGSGVVIVDSIGFRPVAGS